MPLAQSKFGQTAVLCIISTLVLSSIYFKNQLRVWLEYEELPVLASTNSEEKPPSEMSYSHTNDLKDHSGIPVGEGVSSATKASEDSSIPIVQNTAKDDMIINETPLNSNERLMHLNSMTAKELEDLNGVGPVLAKRIVEDRAKLGPFKSLEELNRVKGIGEKKLKKILESLK